VRIAVDMVRARILTEREAIMKVDPAQVHHTFAPRQAYLRHFSASLL
jgi:hypothetical protein